MTTTDHATASPKFLKITFAPSDECVATAVAAAGGTGHDAEELGLRDRMTFWQRVHVDNVREYLSGLREQGYEVVDIAYAVPPIA